MAKAKEPPKPKKEFQGFAGRLKELRGRTPVSAIARRLKVSDKTVEHWLGGRHYPSDAHMQALAKFFRTSVDYLERGEPEPQASTDDLEEIRSMLAKVLKAQTELMRAVRPRQAPRRKRGNGAGTDG